MTVNTTVNVSHHSRAVTRPVEPGSWVTCTTCRKPVKFRTKIRVNQVIANVYVDGRWDRVEHYHEACYQAVGEPYGTAA